MEKINIQVNNLKLNVTNIKSSLISSNKKLKKLRSDKISLFSKEKDREEKLKKEKSIESPMEGLGKFGRTVGGIARNIAKGPLSFFDTIKEFFGLLLTGIIINNLPYIIDQIKGFFDRNKWLVEGTKFILSVIGKGIMGIINLVDKFTPSQQDKINGDAKKLKEEFSRLDRNLGDDNAEIDKRLKELQKQEDDETKNKRQADYVKNITSRQESRSSTPSPGSIDPQSSNPAPQPRRTPEKPPEVQKFAKGGIVQPRKSVDTGTKPQATKTMTAGSSSLGTTKASVRSKKAVQTVNYFSFFNNNNQVSEEIALKDEKNKETFKEILVSLKSIQEIRKQIGDEDFPGQRPRTRPGPGQQPSLGEPVDVDPDEVIGTVGSTGMSTGPHIHLESVSSNKTIPESLRKNIFVNGKSLTSNNFPLSSPVGERFHPILKRMKYHAGEDWPAPANSQITLRGGVKFVKYIPEGSDPRYDGYGNVTVIQDTDGKQYFMGHLNAGPSNLQALKKKQDEKIKARAGSAPPGITDKTGKKASLSEVVTLLRNAGASESEVEYLSAIAFKENADGSTGKIRNRPDTDDLSYGLWQINMIGSLGPERLRQFGISSYDDLLNPSVNARAALILLRSSGKSTWRNSRNKLTKRDIEKVREEMDKNKRASRDKNNRASISPVSKNKGSSLEEEDSFVATTKIYNRTLVIKQRQLSITTIPA